VTPHQTERTQTTARPSAGKGTRLRLTFRALRHRNYRLFFGGQAISLIGTWMQRIAMAWLVYRLTGSAFLLGVVGFAGQIPTFLLVPFTGVLADRWNRHHILIATQTLSMLQALVLAALVLEGSIAIWHIVSLSVFLGLVSAFDVPARQAFVVQMVESKEDLGNAIALNSSVFNSARLLGPSIAGLLTAAVGEGLCFLLNGLSFLAVIAALLAMKLPPKEPNSGKAEVLRRLADGFSYAFGFRPIRAVILLLALISLVGMPYAVLMPLFAKDVLHGGAQTLGFLMGSAGVGALVGAIYLASRVRVVQLGRTIPVAAAIFGAGLVAFSRSGVLLLSLAFLAIMGFGMMVQMAASNTVLQTIVDDDKRGRVMAFYAMALMGTAPFGSLLAGGLASKMGAPNTLLAGGLACIAGSLLFAGKLPSLRAAVRPIYAEMGVTTGAAPVLPRSSEG
jgi:MFS family permease